MSGVPEIRDFSCHMITHFNNIFTLLCRRPILVFMVFFLFVLANLVMFVYN